MKFIILITVLCVSGMFSFQILLKFVHVSEIFGEINETINHRGRFFMRTVNEARIILASGLIRQLKPLGLEMIKLPPVGPAANMYRMKWSVEMETVAKKSLKSPKLNSFIGNFKEDGYSGFYWQHDLVEAAKKFIKKHVSIDFGVIESALKRFSAAIETLIFIVWAVVTYPKSFPIPNDAEIGPSEALYAHRYEMGCAFDDYVLCLMRDTKANGTLYEEGVACTKCPTHCEFTETLDGSIDEGDLCVPPEAGSELDDQRHEFDEMQAFIDSSSSISIFILIPFLILTTLI
ncbi:unnamed protein product [Caenorhabditis brenneri]